MSDLVDDPIIRSLANDIMKIKARMNKLFGTCGSPDAEGCPESRGGFRTKNHKYKRRTKRRTKKRSKKRTKKKTRNRRNKSKRRKGGASKKMLNINHKKIVGKDRNYNIVPDPTPTLAITDNGVGYGSEVMLLTGGEYNRGRVVGRDPFNGSYSIEMHYPSDEGVMEGVHRSEFILRRNDE